MIDLAATVAQLFHRRGDDLAALAVELRRQCVGAVVRAVVDDDGRAVVRERGDGRAAGAAGADDGDAVVGEFLARDRRAWR